MAYECLEKSPIVNVGQTFVTKYGNIRLISVYDSGSGKIGVKPIGLLEEIRNTKDWQVESFYDGLITVKTNFFTLAGRGAHFWVCNEIEEIDPLRITAITVYEVTNPDMVIADVLINGAGTGTLTIAWGDQGTTTHAINGAGQYYFEKSLPVGTYNICGSIGTTQECATIIIGEPDTEPTPLHVTSITTYNISDPKAVMADIIINGDGSGILTIDWGSAGNTTHNIEGSGQYYFEKSIPDGTYTICAKINDMIPMCSVIVVESITESDPTTCPYCTTKELQNLKISEFKPDRQVPAGDQYAITVMVHDISVLYGDYVCLCLHDRDTLDLLYSSGAVKIGANEYLPFQISGQMPDKDLKLKLSVIDDNVWPLDDDCEDFRDFEIKVGEYKGPDDDYLLMYVALAVVVAFIGVFLISRR